MNRSRRNFDFVRTAVCILLMSPVLCKAQMVTFEIDDLTKSSNFRGVSIEGAEVSGSLELLPDILTWDLGCEFLLIGPDQLLTLIKRASVITEAVPTSQIINVELKEPEQLLRICGSFGGPPAPPVAIDTAGGAKVYIFSESGTHGQLS